MFCCGRDEREKYVSRERERVDCVLFFGYFSVCAVCYVCGAVRVRVVNDSCEL